MATARAAGRSGQSAKERSKAQSRPVSTKAPAGKPGHRPQLRWWRAGRAGTRPARCTPQRRRPPRRVSGALLAWSAVGLVIVIVAVLVIVKLDQRQLDSPTSPTRPVTAAPASVVTTSPTSRQSVYNKVAGRTTRHAAGHTAHRAQRSAAADHQRQVAGHALLRGRVLPLLRGRTVGHGRRPLPLRDLVRSQDHRLLPHRRRRRDPHLQLLRRPPSPAPTSHFAGIEQYSNVPTASAATSRCRSRPRRREAISQVQLLQVRSLGPPPGRSPSPSSTSTTGPLSRGPATTPASWPA